MRSFAYWPTLALLVLAAAVVLVMTARAPARLHLADLAADPGRWDGKRVQVSGLVGRFDADPGQSMRRGVCCRSFTLVDSAEADEQRPVWILVEAREWQPEIRLGEGQKVMVTGRYYRSGCIFSRPNQLRLD